MFSKLLQATKDIEARKQASDLSNEQNLVDSEATQTVEQIDVSKTSDETQKVSTLDSQESTEIKSQEEELKKPSSEQSSSPSSPSSTVVNSISGDNLRLASLLLEIHNSSCSSSPPVSRRYNTRNVQQPPSQPQAAVSSGPPRTSHRKRVKKVDTPQPVEASLGTSSSSSFPEMASDLSFVKSECLPQGQSDLQSKFPRALPLDWKGKKKAEKAGLFPPLSHGQNVGMSTTLSPTTLLPPFYHSTSTSLDTLKLENPSLPPYLFPFSCVFPVGTTNSVEM